MRHRYLLFASFLLVSGLSAHAQTAPVWSTDVAPIIYNHCSSCHHNGGIAPFELMTYADCVAQAASMKADVQSGVMPPWPPDPNYSRMSHERLLSAAEKSTIVAWVNGGTPQGNPASAPPQPTFSNSGDLPGTPDLVLKMPTYTSTASSADVYRCFVLPTGLTADRYITAMEAIPGNRSIVHHVLIFADTTGKSTLLDAQDPGPGYTNFGGIGVNEAILLGGWVPGSAPIVFPTGFGSNLPQNAKVVIQIHYPQGTAGEVDSTELHFKLAPVGSTPRPIYMAPVLNHNLNINTPLVIPANTTRSFSEQYRTPALTMSMLGVAPHMHLLGQWIKAYGLKQNGDTQKYISIPTWDFHWQGFYLLKNILKVDPGTMLTANAFYDNTTNNPENPSSPPRTVSAGESTTDEMMLVFFVYTYYMPGDELISMDASLAVGPNAPYYTGNQLLQPYPLPAKEEVIAKYYFTAAATATLDLYNSSGQIVRRIFKDRNMPQGYGTTNIPLSGVATGLYYLKLSTGAGTQVQKVVVE